MLDGVAQANILVTNKPRKAHAVGLAFAFGLFLRHGFYLHIVFLRHGLYLLIV